MSVSDVILLVISVALFLFLGLAMVKPEWF